MPRIWDRTDIPELDTIIAEYQAGESFGPLVKKYGYSVWMLRNRFKERGITTRRKRMDIPELDAVVSEYQAGKPLQVIAKEYGYSYGALRVQLKRRGVVPRNVSEGVQGYWKYRRAHSEACADLDGAFSIDEARTKAALTKFEKQVNIHRHENEIADIIRDAQFSAIQQFPVGMYNLDIALNEAPIAVEICHTDAVNFNKGRTGNRPQKERIKYLCDRGWFVIYVIATGSGQAAKRTINVSLIRSELINWLARALQSNDLFGCYHVIWGNGSPPPRARYDFGNNRPCMIEKE